MDTGPLWGVQLCFHHPEVEGEKVLHHKTGRADQLGFSVHCKIGMDFI